MIKLLWNMMNYSFILLWSLSFPYMLHSNKLVFSELGKVLLFSILWGSWTSYHLQKEWVKIWLEVR